MRLNELYDNNSSYSKSGSVEQQSNYTAMRLCMCVCVAVTRKADDGMLRRRCCAEYCRASAVRYSPLPPPPSERASERANRSCLFLSTRRVRSAASRKFCRGDDDDDDAAAIRGAVRQSHVRRASVDDWRAPSTRHFRLGRDRQRRSTRPSAVGPPVGRRRSRGVAGDASTGRRLIGAGSHSKAPATRCAALLLLLLLRDNCRRRSARMQRLCGRFQG